MLPKFEACPTLAFNAASLTVSLTLFMSASQSKPIGSNGWEPNFESKLKRLFRLRRFLRANQYLGMTIHKSTYANGWNIKHTSSQWTVFTIYIDAFDGFSLFQAIPDIDKGFDCCDEKHLITTSDLFLLYCAWTSAWQLYLYGRQPQRIKEVWQGKLEQSFKEWPRT